MSQAIGRARGLSSFLCDRNRVPRNINKEVRCSEASRCLNREQNGKKYYANWTSETSASSIELLCDRLACSSECADHHVLSCT